MIFWIFLAITIGLIIWTIFDYWEHECLFVMSAVSSVITFVMLLILIFCNTVIDGEIAANKQEYESLVYQYENDIYENDNDLGKKELMDDIQYWNESLARNRENQDDFWIGIFYPNIYDQFEFIELK